MKLVDANALIQCIEEQKQKLDLFSRDYIGYAAYCLVQDIIKFFPPIDAVQVIRCKDCRFYEESYADHCGLTGIEVHSTHFCDWAELKEDDEYEY